MIAAAISQPRIPSRRRRVCTGGTRTRRCYVLVPLAGPLLARASRIGRLRARCETAENLDRR